MTRITQAEKKTIDIFYQDVNNPECHASIEWLISQLIVDICHCHFVICDDCWLINDAYDTSHWIDPNATEFRCIHCKKIQHTDMCSDLFY